MKGPIERFERRHVVFIGHGREGHSFRRFMFRYGDVASFTFVDRCDGPDYLDALARADPQTTVVVKTPGCPGATVPVPYTTPTNLFLACVRRLGATLVGVTGTKGKSTTTAMIGAILRENGRDAVVCGNIGVPMLDALDRAGVPPDGDTVFVAELSSYQLADVTASPNLAVVTNLYEDHVPYHGSVQAYEDAKRNIVRHMGAEDVLVYHPEFGAVVEWAEASACRAIPIDPHAAIDMRGWRIWGDHNRLNALLAIKVAGILGIPEGDAQGVLRTLAPLPHRMQAVGCVQSVPFIDNAIGGNPAATIAAIRALGEAGKTIGCLVVGGVDRHYDFDRLGQAICTHNIRSLVLLPDTGPAIREALPCDAGVRTHAAGNMRDAVDWAVEQCRSGAVCLLSPASPAQTISRDFEDLGRQFADAVHALAELDPMRRSW